MRAAVRALAGPVCGRTAGGKQSLKSSVGNGLARPEEGKERSFKGGWGGREGVGREAGKEEQEESLFKADEGGGGGGGGVRFIQS